MKLRLADFPQLRLIAWNRHAGDELDEAEAFALYEAHRRHIDEASVTERERELMRRLTVSLGAGFRDVGPVNHQRLSRLLGALDASFLEKSQCYLGGGSAITFALAGYRESASVDFLCASTDGYRALRATVFDGRLGAIAKEPLKLMRDLRTDQYGIRTFIEIDSVAIKFEIVREARIELGGAMNSALGVPVLAREDLFAEKLLANADRSNDRATWNCDAIDLGMMVAHWGPVPDSAWMKSRAAYGPTIDAALANAIRRLDDATWFEACARAMHLRVDTARRALEALHSIVP